eukprot:SAG22_NODE_9709_length_574_cov_0.762105_1_plen_23_part_10
MFRGVDLHHAMEHVLDELEDLMA